MANPLDLELQLQLEKDETTFLRGKWHTAESRVRESARREAELQQQLAAARAQLAAAQAQAAEIKKQAEAAEAWASAAEARAAAAESRAATAEARVTVAEARATAAEASAQQGRAAGAPGNTQQLAALGPQSADDGPPQQQQVLKRAASSPTSPARHAAPTQPLPAAAAGAVAAAPTAAPLHFAGPPPPPQQQHPRPERAAAMVTAAAPGGWCRLGVGVAPGPRQQAAAGAELGQPSCKRQRKTSAHDAGQPTAPTAGGNTAAAAAAVNASQPSANGQVAAPAVAAVAVKEEQLARGQGESAAGTREAQQQCEAAAAGDAAGGTAGPSAPQLPVAAQPPDPAEALQAPAAGQAAPPPPPLPSPPPADLQVQCPPVGSLWELQQQLRQWAQQQQPHSQPRTLVVDLGGGGGGGGGAELPPGPHALVRGVLRVPARVSVLLRNGTLPVPVVTGRATTLLLQDLTLQAHLWQRQPYNKARWRQVARGLVTATGAGTRVAVVGCRLLVSPKAATGAGAAAGGGPAAAGSRRPVRSCTVGPPLVKWKGPYLQNGVVAEAGAKVLVVDCSIDGPHDVELQQRWLCDGSPLDCTGVMCEGAGSLAVALRTRAQGCIEGFGAWREGRLEAYGCVVEDGSYGFEVWEGGRMRCGRTGSAAATAAAAAAAGEDSALEAAAATSSMPVGAGNGSGTSGSGSGGPGDGCRAVGMLMIGFAAYERGSEMELLEGCSSERCGGTGCLAREGALRVSGFTSVGDLHGFCASKPGGLMQLGPGCVARAPKQRGVLVQEEARLEIGMPPDVASGAAVAAAAAAAGTRPTAGGADSGGAAAQQLPGQQEGWDVLVDGCGSEGLLANGGTLVMLPGARVLARGCGGDGFTAAAGGLLDAAAAAECVAQGSKGRGFCAEDAGSRLRLGSGVCVAVGNSGHRVLSKEGGVVEGALRE